MSRFNLIDEKWIPVRYLNGTRAELGISETLLQSKEIAVIEDASPLVTAALYRILLAVLYRALEGPTDIKQAKTLFTSGLPAETIRKYLKKWQDRFWLFDEEYPFGQIPKFKSNKIRAWTVLAAEHNADTAKVLFDHTSMTDPGSIGFAKAARWLLATQTFSLSGGNSELLYIKDAPSATAAMVIPLGRDLQDSLLLSLVPQNRAVLSDDIPIWEREPESLNGLKEGIERSISGYADLYTWRNRCILLMDNNGGCIEKLGFASGVGNSSESQVDPMLGYRIDEKKGKLPVQFRERGLWRDYDSLLPDNQNHLAPMVIEHAAVLTRSMPERFPKSIMILGQANDSKRHAKINFWRMERFALPEAIMGDRFIREEIRQLLDLAEDAQRALRAASSCFARDILSRGERDPVKGERDPVKGERDPVKNDIKNFVAQMPVISEYWSELEICFHDILQGYTLERSPDDIKCQWLKSIRNTLDSVWKQYRAGVSMGDAWAIRAVVKAEIHIDRKLKELNNNINQLEQQQEVV
jgi:CRISPR system Cascade subunit CasA